MTHETGRTSHQSGTPLVRLHTVKCCQMRVANYIIGAYYEDPTAEMESQTHDEMLKALQRLLRENELDIDQQPRIPQIIWCSKGVSQARPSKPASESESLLGCHRTWSHQHDSTPRGHAPASSF